MGHLKQERMKALNIFTLIKVRIQQQSYFTSLQVW